MTALRLILAETRTTTTTNIAPRLLHDTDTDLAPAKLQNSKLPGRAPSRSPPRRYHTESIADLNASDVTPRPLWCNLIDDFVSFAIGEMSKR